MLVSTWKNKYLPISCHSSHLSMLLFWEQLGNKIQTLFISLILYLQSFFLYFIYFSLSSHCLLCTSGRGLGLLDPVFSLEHDIVHHLQKRQRKSDSPVNISGWQGGWNRIGEQRRESWSEESTRTEKSSVSARLHNSSLLDQQAGLRWLSGGLSSVGRPGAMGRPGAVEARGWHRARAVTF